MYSPKELGKVLIKLHKIHKGYWALATEFKLVGTNSGPVDSEERYPTAVVPIVKIGIQPVKKDHPLAMDAAKFNPRRKSTSGATITKRRR